MRYRKATSARELKISGLDLSHPTICCSLCLADSAVWRVSFYHTRR